MTRLLQRALAISMLAMMHVAPVLPAHAQQGIAADDIRLELVLEDRPTPPHPGEMVLLMIRGTFKVPVVRETLQQSPLEGLDWMQLGEDRWSKAREDGFEVLKFERRMALFPQQSGEIRIAPFVHRLEVLNPRGATVRTSETSNSVTITANPVPESPGWWFPARGLAIEDRWSNQPETLDAGAAALRIVTLTVEGTAPQRIPPMPALTGAGAFIFAHPEQRIVSLGPDGPITRVFWRWTVRPLESSAGYVNRIPIPYFDTETREMRTLTLSAQRVAYADGPQQVRADAAADPGTAPEDRAGIALPAPPRWLAGLALLIGLIIGGAPAWSRLRAAGAAWPRWLRPDPDLRALRRAVRQENPAEVWRHGRALTADRDRPATLAGLDASLFGTAPMPALRSVARDVRAARRL